MLKILKSIVSETGYRPDVIKRILTGKAKKSSSKRLRLAIYRVTGRLIPLSQLAKGEYSTSPIVRGLASMYSNSCDIKFTKLFFKVFFDADSIDHYTHGVDPISYYGFDDVSYVDDVADKTSSCHELVL